MRKKQASGGIEKKFLTSILWVGVVPMTLALIIGYVFAREGQQLAAQQNLGDAAWRTAQGVQREFEHRLLMTARLAQDAQLVSGLRAEDTAEVAGVLERLRHKSIHRRDVLDPEVPQDALEIIVYSAYDASGAMLASTDASAAEPVLRPEWIAQLENPRFIGGLDYHEALGHYAAHAVAPVRDPDSDALLGYLMETKDVQKELEQALGRGRQRISENLYEIAFLGQEREVIVYLEPTAEPGDPARLRFAAMDDQLAERLRADRDLHQDTFSLWPYRTRGEDLRALISYHRLFDDNLYVIVYRPLSDVFAKVNLAAILTILLSSLVIGFFVIVSYRFVNNNIIRPVSLLNEGAQIIRQGDLELKLIIGTGDEIEELASSFNKMATALRQNINQLEASEEKYRSLVNSMRDGIFQTNRDGDVTFVNPAGVEILGYKSAEEVIGLSLRQLFIEQIDYARVTNELAKRRFIERTRVWMRKPDGRSICVELSSNRVFDEDRGVLGMEGTFRDVTQNVRLEQESRERSERISAINQIANAINSSLEAGRVYESIVVEVRKLVNFDFAAVALLDAEATTFEIRRLWPEPGENDGSMQHGDSEASSAAWVAREHRCLIVDDLRDGDSPFATDFPEEIHSCLCVPLYATGRIIGTLNLGARDRQVFTRYETEVLEQMAPHVAVAIRNAQLLENLQHSLEEVTRAREKLHEVNEELKTLDEMKTHLLSNVSHELRTPLVAVMGYTDMILNGKVGPVNELQQEYLGISLRNIEKLVTLIENLLDFSRLHRGTEEVVFDTMDLVDCVRTSMEIIQPLADGREIALELDCPHKEVRVEGDKSKLGQVFNNLLSNAVKFNHSGGKVSIHITPGEELVNVTVKDTGIGIPAESLDKIFTRFYQYDSSSTRKYGGTGIGLSIAQNIMRLHGTRITVTSTPGQGSAFSFTLPLSAQRRQKKVDTEHEIRVPLPTETHLLVELVSQDRALSAQVRNMLISEGMDVIHAAYPAAAISLANKYSPDCILVDTEAGPLGSVVLEEILSDPSSGHLPIILLTNDDALYKKHSELVAGRVKRGFRKSTLLSGIHYALSRGVPAGEGLGHKVLCVDDDPEITTFIARCLEVEGYTTDVCETGEEALERAQSGEYWLVLLDIAMPGLDGWETCARLKKDPALKGLKVYFVTAKPVDKDSAKIQNYGADGYLLKPFKPEDLISLIQGFEASHAGRKS